MLSRDEWFFKLKSEYITLELEQRIKDGDFEAYQEYLIKEALADIDADFFYWNQIVENKEKNEI